MTAAAIKICPTHGEWNGRGRRYCPQCFDTAQAARDYQRQLRQRDRANVIEAYGGKCVCCGESEEAFLEIDHVDGGGNAHRREFASTRQIYTWLRANGYPDGFQILCSNCNKAKERPDGCPHRRLP